MNHFSTTLPWSSTKDEAGGTPHSPVNLHKTRSSPSIFAMSNKSSVLYLNPELRQSRDNFQDEFFVLDQNNISTPPSIRQECQQQIIPTKNYSSKNNFSNSYVSPASLRRSQTVNYDCDFKKSSTMPHHSQRSRKSSFCLFDTIGEFF